MLSTLPKWSFRHVTETHDGLVLTVMDEDEQTHRVLLNFGSAGEVETLLEAVKGELRHYADVSEDDGS